MIPVALVLLVFVAFAAAGPSSSPRGRSSRADVLAAQEESARASARARRLAGVD